MSDFVEPMRVKPAKKSPIPVSPIHPYSALTTIVLDNLFGAPEMLESLAPPLLLLSSVTVGLINTVAVTCVQRFLAKDEWGASIAKGLVMGIIAGVPYSVGGTAVGGLLLAWAGLHEWLKLPAPKE